MKEKGNFDSFANSLCHAGMILSGEYSGDIIPIIDNVYPTANQKHVHERHEKHEKTFNLLGKDTPVNQKIIFLYNMLFSEFSCVSGYSVDEYCDDVHKQNYRREYQALSLPSVMKRLVDFTATLLGLLAISPVLVVLWIMVRIKHGSPVLFCQTRPGLYGRPFKMVKFRTMTDERGADGNLLPDEQRLTGFGKFMRSTSLDELPELFNVLKGEMSLVGPRPLLMEYLPLYSREQARRHGVRPGITGWAQVNGRNALSWEEKFKLDVWYVDNWSLWLDMKILWLTAGKVLKRDGISQEGSVTMEKFRGSNPEVVGR